jgi:hypothetical protein
VRKSTVSLPQLAPRRGKERAYRPACLLGRYAGVLCGNGNHVPIICAEPVGFRDVRFFVKKGRKDFSPALL